MTTHLVFVYGSLKAGFHNHGLLAPHAIPFGDAVTVRPHVMIDGGAFPYLLKDAPDCIKHNRIEGELYETNDEGLAVLDRLESHPRFYRRELTHVIPSNVTESMRPFAHNGCLMAWCYFLARPVQWDTQALNAVVPCNTRGNVAWQMPSENAEELDEHGEAL